MMIVREMNSEQGYGEALFAWKLISQEDFWLLL